MSTLILNFAKKLKKEFLETAKNASYVLNH